MFTPQYPPIPQDSRQCVAEKSERSHASNGYQQPSQSMYANQGFQFSNSLSRIDQPPISQFSSMNIRQAPDSQTNFAASYGQQAFCTSQYQQQVHPPDQPIPEQTNYQQSQFAPVRHLPMPPGAIAHGSKNQLHFGSAPISQPLGYQQYAPSSHMPSPGPQYPNMPSVIPQYPTMPTAVPQYPTMPSAALPDSTTTGPPMAKRISSERLPSVIEFVEENRSQCGGTFCSGQRGVVPPLVTTEFSTKDEGNCNPCFIRSSLYAIPLTGDLLKTVGIPFSLSISPFASTHPDDQPIIISDMGPQGPVRCVRCRAYMNPFVSFIDGGRRFVCPLCNGRTDVPADYFAHLDHTGRRTDAFNRPELCLGSYELVATAEYCKNNQLPLPPAFIFILDVSQSAIRSGLVNLFCSQFVDRILPRLPQEEYATQETSSSLRIGFITYDHQLHFYSFSRDGGAPNTEENSTQPSGYIRPQMHIVADVEDVFVPAVEGFLISPEPTAVAALLQLVPSQFSPDPSTGNSSTPDSFLGPAIQAGLEALRAANRPGKLFVFHTNLPTTEAPGKLKNRDNRQLIGTEKEKILLLPTGDFYTGLGQACVASGCSVDLFLFPNAFSDVATIAEVPRLTAGHLYKYICFQSDLQGLQFISDLETAVARPRAFNAVMRVRTSAGIRPIEFFGNCYLPNTTDIELACVDPTTTITSELRHDDKLEENDIVFIQTACLYTSVSGERRLRIHNLSLATATNVSEVFRLSELDAHMNWLSKYAIRSLCQRAHTQVVDDLTAKVASVLAAYRRHCAGGPDNVDRSVELVLPQNMKLYPLYVQCLMKTDAFLPADGITIDDRNMNIFLLNGMNVKESNAYLYPRLYPVHQLESNSDGTISYPPPAIRCSYDFLAADGAYLLDNGVQMYLWLGANLPAEWLGAILNVLGARQFEPERIYNLPRLDNEHSRNLCALIDLIHREHVLHSRLFVVRPGDRLEISFRRLMMEDRHSGNSVSYLDYIVHIHKEVRSLLR